MKLIRKYTSFQSVKLSYLDNESRGESILVTHANGYSGSCYLYLYRYFGDRFRWIFLDFSGHGNSESSLDFNNWNYFADQILHVVQYENLMNPIGIGHSLGAASLSLAVKNSDLIFRSLLLLDPTVLSNRTVILARIFGNKLARNAMKRRRMFSDRDQVKKVFKRFPMFSNWEGSVFEDYVDSCFLPIEGGYRLACPPEVESKIFTAIPLFFPNKFKNLNVETKVVVPKNSDVCSYQAAKKLIGKFPFSDITVLENENHFFPFENPEIVINQLKRLLHE